MAFEPVDRLPAVEWAHWWHQTLDQWYGQGLPETLQDPWEIRRHLGLDSYVQLRIFLRDAGCREPIYHGGPVVDGVISYDAILPYLYLRFILS